MDYLTSEEIYLRLLNFLQFRLCTELGLSSIVVCKRVGETFDLELIDSTVPAGKHVFHNVGETELLKLCNYISIWSLHNENARLIFLIDVNVKGNVREAWNGRTVAESALVFAEKCLSKMRKNINETFMRPDPGRMRIVLVNGRTWTDMTDVPDKLFNRSITF